MPLEVTDREVTGETRHTARSVGAGGWVVSYLPGRTVGLEQAIAAIRAAEAVEVLTGYAPALGITPVELTGMAHMSVGFPTARPQRRSRWPWRRSGFPEQRGAV